MKQDLCSVLVFILAWTPLHAQEPKQAPFLRNSLGIKFVRIAPGSFMMGSPNSEKSRGDDEILHKVVFTRPLYLGIHAITQEQWQAVMGSNPSHFRGEKNLPVDNVSWHDCQEFCARLRAIDKKPYRLPTEAEWEYACRAGATTPFHFGDTLSTEQANYNGTFTYGNGRPGVYRARTIPVGSLAANAWGLHDMHGNLWQWCQDRHGGYARQDSTDPQGPATGENRLLRGGSWGNHPVFLRAANRNFGPPDARTEYYGLRVGFTPPD